jgi:hypothetical protein
LKLTEEHKKQGKSGKTKADKSMFEDLDQAESEDE